MGNRLKQQANKEWNGEDQDSQNLKMKISTESYYKPNDDEEESLLKEKSGFSPSSNSSSSKTREVKIKITKKELEELLTAGSLQGASVRMIIDQLMNGSDQDDTFRRSWRPNLQSIPE